MAQVREEVVPTSIERRIQIKTAPHQQKTLSIYTILAVTQSIFWLCMLPYLCRQIWPLVFGKIQSPIMKELVLNQTPLILFCCYGLCILPIYYIQHPLFEQFKIEPTKPWPWLDQRVKTRQDFWKLVKKSCKLCSFNLLVLVPLATLFKGLILHLFCIHQNYCSFISFNDEDWPSTFELIKHNITLTLLHELFFHCTHRIMHIYPSLYKYHKVHHEYKNNIFLSAQHNHPVDYILSIAGPVLLALTIVKPHSFTQCQWAIYTVYTNLDDHVGYSFPFSPVRWFPFASLTQEHEFHHSVNVGCFSSKLDLYEKLFRTSTKFIKWEAKRIETIEKVYRLKQEEQEQKINKVE